MTSEEIVVSVIVITYNHEKFLTECLDSILGQEVGCRIQLIIGEDGSEDSTRMICLDYKNRHPDTIVLRLQDRKNVIYIDGKPTGRYNFIDCLSVATGDYIAFCEGDDYWSDNTKLQQQVEFLEENRGFGLCFHGATKFYEDTKKFEAFHLRKPKEVTDITDLLKGENYIPTASILLRRELVNLPSFFVELPFADYFLSLMCAKDGQKIKFIDKEMAVYRIHGGGTHSVLLNSNKNLILAHRKHIKFWTLMLNHNYFGRDDLNTAMTSNYKYILHFAKQIGDIRTLLECINKLEEWAKPISWTEKIKLIIKATWNKLKTQS